MSRRSNLLFMVSFALLVMACLSPPDIRAQANNKNRKSADPEGQPLRRAVPDSVQVTRDIVYAKYADREVKLDLYLPKKPPSDKLPCIVVVHGGGWRSGDKTRFAHLASYLADHGFAAACIGYRLLPEVEFPAPIMDCKAAVRWVRANAGKNGIDPNHIGAIGGSAGGHLVATLATSHREPKLEGEGGNPGISSQVQAVVAMATPADMTGFASRAKLEKEMAALISPVTHVSKDSAPILLLHGTKDGTVPMRQSELLLSKYEQAGAPATLVKIEDGNHAFWNRDEWFEDTMKRSEEFFRENLIVGKPDQP